MNAHIQAPHTKRKIYMHTHIHTQCTGSTYEHIYTLTTYKEEYLHTHRVRERERERETETDRRQFNRGETLWREYPCMVRIGRISEVGDIQSWK